MNDLLRDPAVPFAVLIATLAGLGLLFARREKNRLEADNERARERFRRKVEKPVETNDTVDEDSAPDAFDALDRMADRYENSGDTQAAAHARTAAERGRSYTGLGSADDAATAYLASVGATDVASAWSSLSDDRGRAESSVVTAVGGPTFDSTDGGSGSTGSDNS